MSPQTKGACTVDCPLHTAAASTSTVPKKKEEENEELEAFICLNTIEALERLRLIKDLELERHVQALSTRAHFQSRSIISYSWSSAYYKGNERTNAAGRERRVFIPVTISSSSGGARCHCKRPHRQPQLERRQSTTCSRINRLVCSAY